MGKEKKLVLIASALVCTLLFSQGTYVYAAENAENTNVQETTEVLDNSGIKDDFYNAVNKEWFSSAKIADGKTQESTFIEVNNKIMEQKKEIIKDLLSNENSYSEKSDEKKIINLYKNALNMEERNKQGIEPIKQIINEMNNIKSVKDISNLNIDSNVSSTLIRTMCNSDLKDVSRNALYIGAPKLSLGDSGEYKKPTEKTERVKQLVTNFYTKVLTLSGYSEEEAKTKIDNLFKFENMIAPYIESNEEYLNDDNAVDNQYNVYTLDELDALAPNLDIKTIAKNSKLDNAKKIILTEPKWFEALNNMYTDENLQIIKDDIEINNIVSITSYLGQDFLDAITEFNNAYTGSKGDISSEERAINMVNSVLGQPFGRIYVEKYFSDKVKDDITDMTEDIIIDYKQRIKNLDWMSDATKNKAIEKLDKMQFKIAYPNKWEDYSSVSIRSFEEGGSLLENIQNIGKFAFEKTIDSLNEQVDKTRFACNPQTVNAFYDGKTNSITIPAGILQDGIYDINASKEKNLGAIGAVIGHEVSHAFDNNGAKYDSDGNLNNWWTEEDYNKFKEKTDKVREYYSNVKCDNGLNVDGSLTLGENISDIAGIACTIDILNKMDNPNYKEFFESNARVWREIATDKYNELRLKGDVHSPNKIRVNVVLPQFEEFYKTYGIKEGDKMYVKPEDRLKIW